MPAFLLCSLKHALELTPFGFKISLGDWQLFKVIKDNTVVRRSHKPSRRLLEDKKVAENEE